MTPRRRPPAPLDRRPEVLDRLALTREGPALDPLTAEALEEIAVEALGGRDGRSVVRRRASLEEFLGAAERLAVERGLAGPLDLARIGSSFDLSALERPSRVLVGALIGRDLLEGGAEWVEGDGGPVEGEFFHDLESDHAVAWPILWSHGFVASSPDSIAERTAGRRCLVGGDRAALARRVAEIGGRSADGAAAEEDVDAIASALGEEPENEHLRRRVYDLLAAAGRLADVVAIVESLPDDRRGPARQAQAALEALDEE